jgi:hypothetical protein
MDTPIFNELTKKIKTLPDNLQRQVLILWMHWREPLLPKNRIPTHPGEILLEEFLMPIQWVDTSVDPS